jgi:hypothetical protein
VQAAISENRRRNSGGPQKIWAPIGDLPPSTWPYTAAGLAAYRAGTPFSLHGFAPDLVTV